MPSKQSTMEDKYTFARIVKLSDVNVQHLPLGENGQTDNVQWVGKCITTYRMSHSVYLGN